MQRVAEKSWRECQAGIRIFLSYIVHYPDYQQDLRARKYVRTSSEGFMAQSQKKGVKRAEKLQKPIRSTQFSKLHSKQYRRATININQSYIQVYTSRQRGKKTRHREKGRKKEKDLNVHTQYMSIESITLYRFRKEH